MAKRVNKAIRPIPVVLDTDIGGDIDDTWALAMALRSPEIDLRLVLTDTADTVYRAKLAAKLLEAAGRTDIPVGIGARFAGDGPRERQKGWVADYDLAAYPGTVYEDGIGAMIELVMDAPGPMTLVAVSPAPNLALALEREPRIAGKVDFVGMFGSIRREHDGKAGAIAEWNVVRDIPAAQKVFAAPWRSFTITPLDTCGVIRLDGKRYEAIRNSPDPVLKAVMANYRMWAAAIGAPEGEVDRRTSILYDTVAVHLAFTTRFLTMQALYLRVTDNGFTLPDPTGRTANVAIDWADLDGYLDFLAARLLAAR